jgi:hypothetical protein
VGAIVLPNKGGGRQCAMAPPTNFSRLLMLEMAGLDGIQSYVSMFSMTVWFQRKRYEAMLSVVIVEHVLYSPW